MVAVSYLKPIWKVKFSGVTGTFEITEKDGNIEQLSVEDAGEETPVKQVKFSMENYKGANTNKFRKGTNVEVYMGYKDMGYVQMFTGKVDGSQIIESKSAGAKIMFSSKDYQSELIDKKIERTFEEGLELSQVITILIAENTTNLNTQRVEVTTSFLDKPLVFKNITLQEAINKIAVRIGWEFFVDDNKSVVFRDPDRLAEGAGTVPVLEYGVNISDFDFEDYIGLVNRVYVFGKSSSNTTLVGIYPRLDTKDISENGELPEKIDDFSLNTQEKVDKKAEELFLKHEEEKIKIRLNVVGNPNIQVRKQVFVKLKSVEKGVNYDVENYFKVTQVSHAITKPGGFVSNVQVEELKINAKENLGIEE